MKSLIEFEGYKVRILNDDGKKWDGQGEPWFIPVDIATAIGYSNPEQSARNILNRHTERFTGLKAQTNLVYAGLSKDSVILNESGLYMFLMVARTKKAIEFQHKVTEVLKDVRKGKYIHSDSTALEAVKQLVGIVENNTNRVNYIENRVQEVERKVEKEVLITYRQATTVKFAVAERVKELLGDDYKKRSRQYFSWLYKEIYARFGIPSYRDIPRAEYDKVLLLIRDWYPVQSAAKTG